MVSDKIVKVAFERKLDEVKDGIESGRITFYNPPDVWTEEMMRTAVLNVSLVMLAEVSKWN